MAAKEVRGSRVLNKHVMMVSRYERPAQKWAIVRGGKTVPITSPEQRKFVCDLCGGKLMYITGRDGVARYFHVNRTSEECKEEQMLRAME